MRPVNSSISTTSPRLDDVVLVLGEQLVGAQRLVGVVHQRDVGRLVERALQNAGLDHQLFDLLVAFFAEDDRALLLVERVVFLDKHRDDRVDLLVEFRTVVRRTRDDQRRAALVDQDRVDFVGDGVAMAALDHVGQRVLHVVAQVVETEFVVGAVGHVAGVGGAALVVVQPVHDLADRKAEEAVDLPHPVRIAAGEIVVDGDDVDALALEGVEIDRRGRHQGLALAGAHLGDGRPN